MKNSEIIKEIRLRTGLSQNEFANKLGVSFATVNRWEKGHCEPSKIAIKGIKELCSSENIDFNQFESSKIIEMNETVTLFHGSKSGLKGNIAPISRDKCDFGKGFYMGTNIEQVETLICNYPEGKIYNINLELSDLKILDLGLNIDWALLIAYNRGKLDIIRNSKMYEKYAKMSKDCDLVIGYIADDRMFVVLDMFFNGEITDVALINSLSALKLGKQYVALTKKACSHVAVKDEYLLSIDESENLKIKSERNRAKGVAMAKDICRKYRREGRFFDEIIEKGE